MTCDVFGFKKVYRCHYPQRPRDSVSPVSRIFLIHIHITALLDGWLQNDKLTLHEVKILHEWLIFIHCSTVHSQKLISILKTDLERKVADEGWGQVHIELDSS